MNTIKHDINHTTVKWATINGKMLGGEVNVLVLGSFTTSKIKTITEKMQTTIIICNSNSDHQDEIPLRGVTEEKYMKYEALKSRFIKKISYKIGIETTKYFFIDKRIFLKKLKLKHSKDANTKLSERAISTKLRELNNALEIKKLSLEKEYQDLKNKLDQDADGYEELKKMFKIEYKKKLRKAYELFNKINRELNHRELN